MVCIAILNWNGFEDTIECLKSLKEMIYDDYFIIVGDNGSTNHSLEKIKDACEESSIVNTLVEYGKEKELQIKSGDVILYDLKENNGFARGNNLIVKYASRYAPDYFLLLNNDTVVEKDFLSNLVEYSKKHPDCKILTPQINYFYDKNIVWNCGGRMFWGFRKYYYAGVHEKCIKEKDAIDLSFITGCALLIHSSLINGGQNLFTERYFHGEEDFDFSIRMKKKNIRMTCVLSSKIYHKVSASTKNYKKNIGKMYMYYLQRHMDIRSHMSVISYFLWTKIYALYIYYLGSKQGYSFLEMTQLLHRVYDKCRILDCISKDYYFNCLSNKNL